MNITKGYVAATVNGDFIVKYQVSTHIGHRDEFAFVGDIEKATVFPGPHMRLAFRQYTGPCYNMVPVEVRREVILLGYGVESE